MHMKKKIIAILTIISLSFDSCNVAKIDVATNYVYIVKKSVVGNKWIDNEVEYYLIKNLDNILDLHQEIKFEDYDFISLNCLFQENKDISKYKDKFRYYDEFEDLATKSPRKSKFTISIKIKDKKITYSIIKASVKFCKLYKESNNKYIYPYYIRFIKLKNSEKEKIKKTFKKIYK